MKFKKGIMIALPIIIMIFFIQNIVGAAASASSSNNEINELSSEQSKKIEQYVNQQMTNNSIPGMSVIIMQNDRCVYKKGFGYSNLDTKKKVTTDTLFELGSTSKAFTALGVQKLVSDGKINLNDSVSTYLPWFKMYYKGSEAKITIGQLLDHTSGINPKTISQIPAGESENALEETVRTLVGQKLDNVPGKVYSYATINYDILGLIIQKVSGESYEKYMQENILTPLNLNNTYLFRNDAASKDFAKGYKVNFLSPEEYDAPMYRGNTPAGYFIINADDMEKWLMIQLGYGDITDSYKKLIDESHTPNPEFKTLSSGLSYNNGWEIYQKNQAILHDGSNPNYSSCIVIDNKVNIAAAVLANTDTSNIEAIDHGIIKIVQGQVPTAAGADMFVSIGKISTVIIIAALILSLVIAGLIVISIIQFKKGKRTFKYSGKKTVIMLVIKSLIAAAVIYCLYKIPLMVYYGGVSWKFMKVWAPKSLYYALCALILFCLLAYINSFINTLLKKEDSRSYFWIILLSAASGLGNSLVIVSINKSVINIGSFHLDLLLIFLSGMVMYVFGQRVVMAKIVNITQDIVYKLRMELLNNILGASYEDLEKVDSGKIQAAMNNDTELLSGFGGQLITCSTALITVICCLIYLGTISLYGLLMSILVLLIIASIYYFAGRTANSLWQRTRTIQNLFFGFINHVILGFKELSLNDSKCIEFKNDMESCCIEYKKKRKKASMKFTDVFIIGEFLFTSAVGIVAFVFPVMFKGIDLQTLISFIFVLLYMTGPINGILNTIPNLIQMKISWGRVKELNKELTKLNEKDRRILNYNSKDYPQNISLELKDIEYKYAVADAEGDAFGIGPFNFKFNSGEITFITGGNGSGKTTLAKLITGLYAPQKGKIMLNDKEITTRELSQNYAAVFSDFHLFEKLYGINFGDNKELIDKYLKLLEINRKIEIKDGAFSTLKLSTGQKKRVALMISYLEKKPIYLFDEWAADQDPEFRKRFYTEFLPELKKMGKCIIVITHDDRYFNLADKVIKLELGKVVDEYQNSALNYIAAEENK